MIVKIVKNILWALFVFGLAYFTILPATNHKSKLLSLIAAVIITALIFTCIQKYLVNNNEK